MLISTSFRLGAVVAATVMAAAISPAAVAQTPSYQLDPSASRVVRLSNLTTGEGCHPSTAFGRVVKREFDKSGLVVAGVVVQAPDGDRSYINVDQAAIDASRLDRATRSWIV